MIGPVAPAGSKWFSVDLGRLAFGFHAGLQDPLRSSSVYLKTGWRPERGLKRRHPGQTHLDLWVLELLHCLQACLASCDLRSLVERSLMQRSQVERFPGNKSLVPSLAESSNCMHGNNYWRCNRSTFYNSFIWLTPLPAKSAETVVADTAFLKALLPTENLTTRSSGTLAPVVQTMAIAAGFQEVAFSLLFFLLYLNKGALR